MVYKLLALLAVLAILGNLLFLKMSMSGISLDLTGEIVDIDEDSLLSLADYSSEKVEEPPPAHSPTEAIVVVRLDGKKSSIIM